MSAIPGHAEFSAGSVELTQLGQGRCAAPNNKGWHCLRRCPAQGRVRTQRAREACAKSKGWKEFQVPVSFLDVNFAEKRGLEGPPFYCWLPFFLWLNPFKPTLRYLPKNTDFWSKAMNNLRNARLVTKKCVQKSFPSESGLSETNLWIKFSQKDFPLHQINRKIFTYSSCISNMHLIHLNSK